MKTLIILAFVALSATSAFAGTAAQCNGPRSNDHFYCARETGDDVGRDENGNGSIDASERDNGKNRNNH